MKTMEYLAELGGHDSVEAWRDQVFQFGANLGYQHATLAIFPSHDTPVVIGNAFLHTTMPEEFLRKYDADNMGEVDPVIAHCMFKSTPLIWSSGTFISSKQRELYHAVCSQGAQSGVVMPHHGPHGEFGILWYAAGESLNESVHQEAMRNIPQLACFRDFVMEVFSDFMRKAPAVSKASIEITARELECMKWCASGKSSWDIAQLMNCTESTVNFHFNNIRRKFGASSRRMAIIKAIQMGFITV